MARTARGADNLEWAREVLAQAQTVEQLRQAQAVVLPLDYGFTMEQTARVIGRSVPWTCRLRNRFLAGEIVGDGQRQARGGRRHQNMTTEQERELLAPFLERARTGGILVVGQVKTELEARLGRSMALSSVYNLLHRHGWRKLAPDKRHPQSDPLAQQEWKKNSPTTSPKPAVTDRRNGATDVRRNGARNRWLERAFRGGYAEVDFAAF